MASMTTYLGNKLALHVLDNTSYTSPTNVYLALFTTGTTDAGGGTEVTGGSYARELLSFTITSNLAEAGAVSFNLLPACTVVAAAIFDALSGGNMLLHGVLPAPRTVAAGGSLPLGADDLSILFK